jgi:tRNA U34 5-methylaminomethyl-2-thiouridine-forming methyltransferase MnmC
LNSITIQTTSDGSKTVYSEEFQETYHSIHGAVVESTHVFIDAGFKACNKNPVNIFEVGFGTGLNAFLTFIEVERHKISVNYQTIELLPLDKSITDYLEYPELLSSDLSVFRAMHDALWNETTEITSLFRLKKIKADLIDFKTVERYDLVYFDAFSPARQPELWSEEIFRKLFNQLTIGGILTTYCAKGNVRRTMEKVGFKTERLPGPPMKREILRARKI